jgi:hypothetical protein
MVSALRTDKHNKKKLLHHEGKMSTKFFFDLPFFVSFEASW